MNLVKSKQRVADHGEVCTPEWMVEAMLDLVKGEAERIDSRFLEPACGSGNFLVEVLRRKLAAVELKYGKSDFEKRHYALLAMMCIYGIELLGDNLAECRANMLEILADYLKLDAVQDMGTFSSPTGCATATPWNSSASGDRFIIRNLIMADSPQLKLRLGSTTTSSASKNG